MNKEHLTNNIILIKNFLFNRLDFLIITIAAIAYILSMFYISYLKYYTFQDTFFDLGLNNEVLWLLSHGFVSNYLNNPFNQIYPLQYEKPIIFLVLPFYSIYPHPVTLIFIQTLFLGLTVFPIYITSRKIIESKLVSGIIAISFLGFFPVASTNLFDFHFTSLFPFFYLITVMFWTMHKRRLMLLSAIVTATINPLTLILIAFFLVYALLLNFKYKKSFFSYIKTNTPILLVVLGLLITLGIYHVFGTLYLAGTNPTIGGPIFLFDINYKLELFLFLFGALAFIPLIEPLTLFFISPYAGFVILSTDNAHFQIFGLHYPVLASGPLYLGLMLGFKSIKSTISVSTKNEVSKENLKHVLDYRKTNNFAVKTITAFIVSVLVFTMVYFPYSPINKDVQGGYFNGNHDIGSLTDITPQVLCLHQIISMIPTNASLITMNDIPQGSGREYIGTYSNHANISYDYILYNSYFNYFTYPNSNIHIRYLINAISNNSYGIVAETPYSLLLEKNYTMPPKLYVPLNLNDSAINLNTFGNATRVGGTIVDNSSSPYMWFGPYTTFFPGIYNFTFYLSSNNVTSNSSEAVYLEVNSGYRIFNSTFVYRTDFPANNTVVAFSLTVKFYTLTPYVQFRGLFYNGATKLTIHSVSINQISGGT